MIMTYTKESLLKDIEGQLLALYDFPEKFEVIPLKYSENIIYKIVFQSVDNESVSPVVFRVHRPGYHDLEELESEMVWMEEIGRDTDIHLPAIFRGRDGKIIQNMNTSDGAKLYCSVISFLEGKVVGDLEGDELAEAVRQIGEITAKLHLQAIKRDKSVVLKRFSWDIHNFFDKDGVWGSWRDFPGISTMDYEFLEKCQEKMTEKMEHYGRSNEHYGVIHADLHFYNIIRNQGVNQIFDFDDSGYGFYMYDLGCTFVTYSENLSYLTEAWVEGYEKHRKLTDADREMLPMFVLLRRIVRLAWFASHWDNDIPKDNVADYYKVTIDMVHSWMEK